MANSTLVVPRALPRLSSTTITQTAPANLFRRYSTTSSTSPAVNLSWADFFKYKKERKTAERVGMVLGGFLGFGAGTYYFGVVKEFDPTDMVFGVLDPAIAYTLGAMAMGAAGAALGIFAGSAAWGIVRSSAQAGMKAREKEFFARIKANRVIPSSQAVSNASPDFYGEKITSLRGYRKWLKSQNKYKEKARFDLFKER